MAVDRRIVRTRELLFDALLDLMIEKGYEAITVQDLIDHANIGRSTFYTHFKDKDQLLAENILNLRDLLKRQGIEDKSADQTDSMRFVFSLGMLRHVHSHKRIYKAVAGKQSGIRVVYHMKNMLSNFVEEELENHHALHTIENIPRRIVVEFIVNTFMTLLTWWMENNMPCSADEVDEIFHKLVLGGIG
jgi:AcrR family transcriptional regulator